MSAPHVPLRTRGSRGALSPGVLFGCVAAVVLAGLVWWFGVKRPADARQARETAEAVAKLTAEAQQARRRAMFGSIADHPGFEFRSTGLGFRILAPGEGKTPGPSTTVRIRYVGRTKDGQEFDRTPNPVEFRLDRLVPGMSAGVQLLRPGGRIELLVPPSLGYGNRPVAGLPPGSGLIFDVSLVAIVD